MTASKKDILILGNLQSGKTTLFRRLCGESAVDISAPKSSLAMSRGHFSPHAASGWPHLSWLRSLWPPQSDKLERQATGLLDTPGTTTLFAQGEEEAVSRDALLWMQPTAILLVADAVNLRRSLALALHAAEFGLPMVLAVNMQDDARRRGVVVDHESLSRRLGIPVIATTATGNEGVPAVSRQLANPEVPARLVRFPESVERALSVLAKLLEGAPCSRRGLALLLLAGDRGAEELVRETLGEHTLSSTKDVVASLRQEVSLPLDVVLTGALYHAADVLSDEVVQTFKRRRTYLDHLGHLAQHPLFGVPIAALVVALLYTFVGSLVAIRLVDWLDAHVFAGFLVPLSERLVAPIPWTWVREAFTDPDFGLLPTGLFLAFGILTPVLLAYYFAFSWLQNSGYLARLCVLLSRILRAFGLSGKGVIPLAMGFSCVTMALVTTRMLDTRKQRIIASFLLLLGVPCAPLLSVMLVILGDLPTSAAVTIFSLIALQILLAGILTNKLLPGSCPDFIMLLPPMRLPKVRLLALQALQQTYRFMKEAVPFFLLASFVLFVFDRLGGLALLERVARPLTSGFLGLPDEAVQVFIKTMIRRENGATELDHVRGGFTNLQVVTSLLVMTCLTPCVNAVLVLAKERGLRVAATIILMVTSYAMLLGGAFNHLCRWAGVSFAGG